MDIMRVVILLSYIRKRKKGRPNHLSQTPNSQGPDHIIYSSPQSDTVFYPGQYQSQPRKTASFYPT